MGVIVGFGALNLDLIFEVKDLKSIFSKGLPLDPGEESFGSDEEFESLLEQLERSGALKSKSGGGSAANTLVALGRMGFPTEFIGKIGEDEEGDFLLEDLKPVQINLEESALFATTVAAGSVMGYGRNCYPTEEDLKNFFH
jgi:ribokinase